MSECLPGCPNPFFNPYGYPPSTPYQRFGNPSPPVQPGLVYQNAEGVYSNTVTPTGLTSLGVITLLAGDVQTTTLEATGLITTGSLLVSSTASFTGAVTFTQNVSLGSQAIITGNVTAPGLLSPALNNLVVGTTSYGAAITITSATGYMALNAYNTNGVITTTSSNGTLVVTPVTGTANAVFSASPTFTGTAAFAAISTTGNIAAAGEITTSSKLGIGYATGAGGTVTQATNKSTGVTLNAACGAITLSNSALGANSTASFLLTNSSIAAGDFIGIRHTSGGTLGSYNVTFNSQSGQAAIYVTNLTSGSLSEAIVLSFVVIKATTS